MLSPNHCTKSNTQEGMGGRALHAVPYSLYQTLTAHRYRAVYQLHVIRYGTTITTATTKVKQLECHHWFAKMSAQILTNRRRQWLSRWLCSVQSRGRLQCPASSDSSMNCMYVNGNVPLSPLVSCPSQVPLWSIAVTVMISPSCRWTNNNDRVKI